MAERLRDALARGAAPKVVPYLTLGDPPAFLDVVAELVDGGCAAIELGVPSARAIDTPVILAAHRRALDAGTDRAAALRLLSRVAAQVRTPLIAVLHAADGGWDADSMRQLASAGAAAALVVGLPLGEVNRFCDAAGSAGLETVLTLDAGAPARLREMVHRRVTGCIYVTARKTDQGGPVDGPAGDPAATCRAIAADSAVPLLVGFGIRDREAVERWWKAGAAACAIGSALAERLERGFAAGELAAWVRGLQG